MSEVVPEGWVSSKLKDVSVLTKGLTYASSDYSDEQNGLPFLTLKSISKDGGYSPVGLKFYKGEYREHHALNIGDVLFANTDLTRNGDVVGSPLFFDGFGFDETTLYSMDLSKLKVDPQKAHSKFLYYLLMTHRVKRYMVNSSAGSTVLHLDTNRVKELDLNIPPLPEQKKIASILTSVDEVIEKTQSQIDKLQDLKKGTMNELLTKGIGHTEFKDSELGRIPKSWKVSKVSNEISRMESGWSPDCLTDPAKSGEWGILKTTAVSWDGFKVEENKALPSDLDGRPQISLCEGDILVTRAGPIDRVGVVAFCRATYPRIMLSDKIIRIQCDEKTLSGEYLSLWLSSPLAQRNMRSKISGMAESQTNISQDILKSVPIPIPNIEEQHSISSILRSISHHILESSSKLHQTQSLKKSLMLDLLTGKVRVSVN